MDQTSPPTNISTHLEPYVPIVVRGFIRNFEEEYNIPESDIRPTDIICNEHHRRNTARDNFQPWFQDREEWFQMRLDEYQYRMNNQRYGSTRLVNEFIQFIHDHGGRILLRLQISGTVDFVYVEAPINVDTMRTITSWFRERQRRFRCNPQEPVGM